MFRALHVPWVRVSLGTPLPPPQDREWPFVLVLHPTDVAGILRSTREAVTREGRGVGKRQTRGYDAASADLEDPQPPDAHPPKAFPKAAAGSTGLGSLHPQFGCV